ncbi:MAG TPA: DUF2141 domain-containing protein [Terracidiphilus sp.]|nr:DUF2141 domain-containing protein [Terracidiphilus sp.]
MTATSSRLHPSTNSPGNSCPRTIAAILLALAAAAACAQQNPAAGHDCTLRIHVDGFRNTRGNLGTIIFTSANGWPEDENKCLRHGPAPIDKSTRTAVAEWRLPPGNYGVAAIHDENSNHKLDRNFLGIPKEGFGFANNPHVGFGPPPFSAAVVHLACPTTDVTIHLIFK